MGYYTGYPKKIFALLAETPHLTLNQAESTEEALQKCVTFTKDTYLPYKTYLCGS